MRRLLAAVLAVGLVAAACSDSGSDTADRDLLTALGSSANGDPGAAATHEGVVSFVAPGYDTGAADPATAALEYFRTFADAYGMEAPGERLEVVSQTATAAGTVVRLRQTLDGLPVFAGEMAVAVTDGGVVSRVTGVVAPDADLEAVVLSGDEAVAAAVDATPGSRASGTDPRQVAFSPAVDHGGSGEPRPAWEIELLVGEQVALTELVVVDAVNGEVLTRAPLDLDAENWEIRDAQNALDDEGRATTNGAVLVAETRGGETEIEDEADSTARALATNLSTTWNYFFDTHGRDGHDDDGGFCRAYVHFGVDWNNAAANTNCSQWYGDGKAYAESLDVVAHEFTHSVVAHTAGLIYEGPSGALNEHYADFFAAMVDTSDWAISPTDRVMSSPEVDLADEYVVTSRDSGGVHTNSGIANLAGFLVADSGTNTHPDTGITVRGIGRDKAEQLWYTTLLSLTPRTGLAAWACATAETAKDMVGGLLTAEDAQSVEDAMTAVGIAFRTATTDDLRCRLVAPPHGAPGPPTTGTTTPDGTTTTASGDGGTTTTVVGGDGTTTTGGGSGVACLIGSWQMDLQSYEQFLNQRIESQTGTGLTITVTGGDVYSRFQENRAFLFRQDDFTTVLNLATPITRVTEGVESGTYEVDDTTLTLDADTVEYTVSGQVATAGDIEQISIAHLLQSATYGCEGDTLTVSAFDGMFQMNRIDAIPSG